MTATATKVEVKERPIIFSGPMVKAILDGRKTQTRRVITPQPSESWMRSGVTDWSEYYKRDRWGRLKKYLWICHPTENRELGCPYGAPGDRLWVRETWQPIRRNSPEQDAAIRLSLDRLDRGQVKDIVAEVNGWPYPPNGKRQVLYAADFSPLFLSRKDSRVTLEITNIRVERIQDISAADAKAEGVEPFLNRDATAWRAGFQLGWDAINAKRGYSWANNPYVWCISFRKL